MSPMNPVDQKRDPALEVQLTRCLTKRGGPKQRVTRQNPLTRSSISAIGQPIYAFRHISSTMDEAHRLAQEGAIEGTLVLALRQERGRGRLGRMWQSPEGGIYLSLILRPACAPEQIPQLSLLAGLAVAEAIQEYTGLYPSIRWPNDLLLEGKKVAGLLVEAKNGAVVLGVGINVTTRATALPQEAISLIALGVQRTLDPLMLVAALCRRFESWYARWSAEGFTPIREALRPWMGFFGQVVHILTGAERFEGTASDLDDVGRLLVRLDSGITRPFEVGEVSLLKRSNQTGSDNDTGH